MDYDREALRRGQRRAIDTVVGRFRRGEATTAIVLPTRYGKSDVARVASLYLWDEGEMSCALALSPNEYLRDQLGSTSKWNEATARYDIHTKSDPKTAKILKRLGVRPNANGEMFLSATVQLVQKNLEVYEAWVRHVIHTTGLRPAIWLDESHTSSTANEWGQVVARLTAAGAHVVLMTATPVREDGQRIPGFEFDEITENDNFRMARTRPSDRPDYVWVDIFEGQRSTLRLQANHETSFGEAWAEGVLCTINHIPFDLGLNAIDSTWTGLLSQASVSMTREHIGRIVRHPTTVREGVKRSVDELRRLQEVVPDVAVIVYCGNDTDKDEPDTNKHAKQIQEEYRQQAPELDTVVATAAIDDAKNVLDSFVGGRHDVLIVKQMASVGIDVGRLKISVDLSPTRTYAAYIQRLMRPATPYSGQTVCSHISPADVISQAFFDKCVRDEGGEAIAADLRLIESREQPRGEERVKRVLTVDGIYDADFSDSHGNQASGVYWKRTAHAMAVMPDGLQRHATAAQVAAWLARLDEEEHEDAVTTVTDTSIDAEALRDEINNLASEFTKAFVFKVNGKYDGALWASTQKGLFKNAYADTPGWPRKPNGQFEELSCVTNLEMLESVRDFVALALQAEQQ